MSCIWVQILSQGMAMGEGRRRGYNDFSLRMSNFLSKRWVYCVVESLFKVFLFEMACFTFVGNESIYNISEG